MQPRSRKISQIPVVGKWNFSPILTFSNQSLGESVTVIFSTAYAMHPATFYDKAAKILNLNVLLNEWMATSRIEEILV